MTHWRRLRLLPRQSGLSCDAMVDQVPLSSLRNGKYVLRVTCTRAGECFSSWEVDIDQTVRTLGDISLSELRGKLRCAQCNAPIMTTLISLK
jgi:hypothetical protein